MQKMINKQAVTVRIANWSDEKEKLSDIRRQVFIEEQNVPEDMEWDDYDASSTHYLAVLENKVVAAARLKPDGQLGRMAVLAEYRNQGIGSELLRFILQNIDHRKLTEVYLHAQISAIPFYEKQGFTAHSETFYEADIPHQKMFLAK